MNANPSGWRPEINPETSNITDIKPATFTGNCALMLEEALIFEIGDNQTTGVDFAKAPASRRIGT
jgi:glycine dehydrogenase subunit 2